MKRVFAMTLIALTGWLAAGCAADDGSEVTPSDGPLKQQSAELADIALNDGWQWIEQETKELHVIRTAEELAAYVRGGQGTPVDVDFTRYSILYVSGRATNGIERIERRLLEDAGARMLQVDVYTDDTMVAPLWHVAVRVDAVPANEHIGLRVNYPNNSTPVPDELTDVVLNNGWQWRMEERNTLHVIRTAEELAAHVTGGEGVAAEVDFSRYSVLFASGRATNGIERIDRELIEKDGVRRLLVRLYLNMTEEAPLWHVAVLLPVLPQNAQVELQVDACDYTPQIDRNAAGLHIEVEDLVVNPGWEWRTDEPTELYIIRSEVELISHMYKRKTNVRPAEIDFSKNAVLFVPGIATSSITRLERKLYVGTRGFSLGIEIYTGMLTVAQPWRVAVVVPIAVANSRLTYTVKEQFGQ